MMQFKHGIFDDANISVIASATVHEIARLAEQPPDVRRFRPNIVVRLLRPAPFQEDDWLGSVLSFGDAADAPEIAVTTHDVRCSMVNLDPDSATPHPRSPEIRRPREPEQRRNLRCSHPHRPTGSRTAHIPTLSCRTRILSYLCPSVPICEPISFSCARTTAVPAAPAAYSSG